VSGSSFTEVTWNDNGITGGGISDVFPLPDFQVGSAIPGSVNDGHQGRGIPDIGGYANGYSIFLNGSMQGPFWGTSETAPLYAGLVALINAIVGDSIGYLNPILYQLGETEVFRDIADGGSNAESGAPGYTAGSGWDACTGWGSIDGTALLNAIETYLFMTILPTQV
jgi:kumamolisin